VVRASASHAIRVEAIKTASREFSPAGILVVKLVDSGDAARSPCESVSPSAWRNLS
jgi:hypothetical protein